MRAHTCRSHPCVISVPPKGMQLQTSQHCSTYLPSACFLSLCTLSFCCCCLPAMIAHQPVVQLTGFNGGRREEEAQQEQQQHRRRQAPRRHPPASSFGASHPARPIYLITLKTSREGYLKADLLCRRGSALSGTCELQRRRNNRKEEEEEGW